MNRLLLFVFLLAGNSTWSADTGPFSQCLDQAETDLVTSIPFFKVKGTDAPLRD